jgi:hypothetical protein
MLQHTVVITVISAYRLNKKIYMLVEVKAINPIF